LGVLRRQVTGWGVVPEAWSSVYVKITPEAKPSMYRVKLVKVSEVHIRSVVNCICKDDIRSEAFCLSRSVPEAMPSVNRRRRGNDHPGASDTL